MGLRHPVATAREQRRDKRSFMYVYTRMYVYTHHDEHGETSTEQKDGEKSPSICVCVC